MVRIRRDHPFNGKGVPIASLQQLPPTLAQIIRIPVGLGTPTGIFLSPPEGRATDELAIMFVFDSVTYGRVWLGESLPNEPDDAARLAEYDAQVAQNGKPNV